MKEGADFYLRVYADKPGGITIDDCVLISRALEERLDAEDRIKDAYILEVSSPGLTRPLKKEKDFARSIGKLVDVKLYRQVNNSKELTGVLMAYNEEEVQLMLDDGDAHEELTINRKDISMIRLAFV